MSVRTTRSGIAFQLGIFLGAYLLFLVQPLMAKQILPWFGGSPSVWSACLLFFQLGLVGGYAYTHLTARLRISTQIALHITLLVVTAATLPIVASAAWKPPDADAPVGRLLGLLAVTVGAPYVMLATTAPLLQDWYRRAMPGKSPYRLYVLSNLGSLAALCSYPLIVERFLPVQAQAVWWSAGFVAFILVCGLCGWQALKSPAESGQTDHHNETATGEPSGRVDQVLWIALSACGSGMLLAFTNQLCQDVAVVPLLWIMPLAVYLLTFITAFAGVYSRRICFTLFLMAFAAEAYVLSHPDLMPLVVQIVTLLFLLGAGCMICHGELVRLRPRAQDLTGFYLALSVGGSLGGLFVTLLAPVVFTEYTEFPLFVLLVPILLGATLLRDAARGPHQRVPAFVWVIPVVAFSVAAFVSLGAARHSTTTLATARNFYGILRVVQDRPDAVQGIRGLYHGRTLQGTQRLNEAEAMRPTAEYSIGTGISVAFQDHPRRQAGLPLRIGVIGLGPGSILAWTQPGDTVRFFELNPQVIKFAQEYFTYLRQSPATVNIVAGDARLSLERELSSEAARHQYDLFTIDAFSSGSIPMHLLTRESFELYQQALAPNGVIAFHISNIHLDLRPVIRGHARDAGMTALEFIRAAEARTAYSSWALVSRNEEFIARGRTKALPVAGDAPSLVWTDGFSSLTSVLR
jgi:hypothetical protein